VRSPSPAIYLPSSGTWFVLLSSGAYTAAVSIPWGVSTDIPVPGDYDGDGKTDLAVYRPSDGTWYILESATNFTGSLAVHWGINTDTPLPIQP